MKDDIQGTNHSLGTADEKKKKKKKVPKEMASVTETFGFTFGCGPRVQLLFALGVFGGVLNGLVYPILAYLFSHSFSKITGAASNGLGQVRHLAFTFMVVGTYALVVATIQSWSLEIAAYHSSQSFRLQWFRALLRQDPAFFDVNDVSGVAAQVGSNSAKFRRGMGRKLGEGVQFFTTGVGGIAYAFYSSWRVALVVLCALPFVSLAAMSTVTINQSKGSRAAKTYKKAGSLAYSCVSAIKTVLSLNAIKEMIRQYTAATAEAMNDATSFLARQGFAVGSMMGSFLCLYAILTLYGSSLLYKDIRDTGCDPSDSVDNNMTCDSSGANVFGALLGVAFAAQGVSQVGNCLESLTAARVAVYEALLAISRKPGAESETIYKQEDENMGSTTRSRKDKSIAEVDAELGEREKERAIKAILPKYEIDSSSDAGLKPASIEGRISARDVQFTYPTRPGDPILKGLNLEIKAGETVALVGPSGGGKSTMISLIERFYDPQSGSIEIDGLNVKEFNVAHLRGLIGLVSQEPALFATTIRGNIMYGKPDATQAQIEEAARLANAHDFITSFSDGYDTQVGDKGSQLSGGQKQRIAIARVLVGDPKILLLDEATSALDSESELVVQEALDNILEQKKITTVIIAHRLSTIRNADTINVIVDGQVVESGNHEELMSDDTYYKRLVEKQEGRTNGDSYVSPATSRNSSTTDLTKLATDALTKMSDDTYYKRLVEKQEGRMNGDSYVLPATSRNSSTTDRTKLATNALTKMKASMPNSVHLEFKNVMFAYPTRPHKLIFDNFNLAVHQGETVALCGPSGQGKSTVVGLIERFYDVKEGVVEYLGNDVRSLNVSWYRDQIGYVGQEPTLFNDSIARNIAYGNLGASRAEIEEAAKQANAHDFIMQFAEGYDTPVGERGTQLSGGQKQRVAIARALVKKPKVLILDEATSALDNESESIVQTAIDDLMASRDHTVIVIAHRLSTIRNADRIAVVSEGKVVEFGPHDELINMPHGRYRRLVDSSKRSTTIESANLLSVTKKVAVPDQIDEEEEEEINWEAKIQDEELHAFSASRARKMATVDTPYLMIGSVGAVLAGGIFPMWGVLFAELINLLFRPVEYCSDNGGPIPFGFPSCQDYWDNVAEGMQKKSFRLAGYWCIVIFSAVAGNILSFVGFGTASERLNKRIRDSSFESLLRQEVAYFDKRSVGSITSRLQDDAARIHAFSGEPLRAFIVALSSIVTGIILSFVHMWQFALLAIGCVPLMGFATSMEMKRFMGEDQGDDEAADELNTPGGILVETLLSIRTVSALTLENQRFLDYKAALEKTESTYRIDGFMSGVTSGVAMFIQQWINALQLWFGGYLLYTFSQYDFKDFLISNFAVLFSLFGLGAAFQDISDRKAVELSAGRIFYLLDRESAIDPLSEAGKKLK